jgi:hypothetical protein
MAHNKVVDLARSAHAERHGGKQHVVPPQRLQAVADLHDDPGAAVAQQELIERIHAELSYEEYDLVRRRASNMTWKEIALELGCIAGAVSKPYMRIVVRIKVKLTETAAHRGDTTVGGTNWPPGEGTSEWRIDDGHAPSVRSRHLAQALAAVFGWDDSCQPIATSLVAPPLRRGASRWLLR